ncbi:MAG: hypothetical protein HGA59_03915 [Chlorobiaceae bacterium]|nr:hypothetical protein [Chlorobiaceae bacterium]
MVCDDAVDLFGHAAVITSQAGLDMADRDVEFGCRKGSGIVGSLSVLAAAGTVGLLLGRKRT